MRKFVTDNLKYPSEAIKARVDGTVTLRYSIDYRGKVVEVKVKKGIGFGCDEEAIRVVKMLRFNVPQNRKKKVRIHQDINISFSLPASHPAPAAAPRKTYTGTTASSTQVSISYIPNKQPVVNKEEKESGNNSYGYTIKW